MNGIEYMLWWLTERNMIDWRVLSAATIAFWNGQNPYAAIVSNVPQDRAFNPFWTFIILGPLAVFPTPVVSVLIVILAIILISLLAYKEKYSKLQVVCLIGAFSLWSSLGLGNIDWLVLTGGLLLPAPIGLLFLAMKPQTTYPLILVMLLQAYDKGMEKDKIKGAIKELIYTGAPLAILTIVWLAVYGLHTTDIHTNTGNVSIWPYGLIAGVPMMLISLYRRNKKLALASGSFVTPYLSFNSMYAMSVAYPVIGLFSVVIEMLGQLLRAYHIL